jgi:hypothetical protein
MQDQSMVDARDKAFEGWEKGDPMYWRDVGPSEIWEASWKAAMKCAELRSLYRARPLDTPPAQPNACVATKQKPFLVQFVANLIKGFAFERKKWAQYCSDTKAATEACKKITKSFRSLP